MQYLNENHQFPNPSEADEDGIVAVGGDLSTERLLLAYRSGIFPWYEEGQPILWWSPEYRMVLYPEDLKISKSLQKTIKSKKFRVTLNTSFSEVIKKCALIKRDGQQGTWITSQMIDAYQHLHELGHALSVEVWEENELVGGLYGVNLPNCKIFCGESMFSHSNDASKVGFCHLVNLLREKDYKLIDCQVYTAHLESLGAQELSRSKFLEYLEC